MTEEIETSTTQDQEKFFAEFYDDGFLKNLYSDKLGEVPETAVEVTEEERQDLFNNLGLRKFVNGEIIEYSPPGPTDDEKWLQIKASRDSLLAQSDWTQLGDSPLTTAKKNEWKAYRQALRDMTENIDVNNVVWPVAP